MDPRELAQLLPWEPGLPQVIDCGSGWHPLIMSLHTRLVGIDEQYRVTTVKEKLGGLRYYVVTREGLDEMLRQRVYDLLAEAESESHHICETCGEPGELSDGPWFRTRCHMHREREQWPQPDAAGTAWANEVIDRVETDQRAP